MNGLKYKNQIETTVRERLTTALNAGVSPDVHNYIEKERRTLKLYREILKTPGLENELVSRIADYAIEQCNYALKPAVNHNNDVIDVRPSYYNLHPEEKKFTFLTTVDKFLTTYQCLLLAEYFNEQIKKEQEKSLKR